MTWETGQWAWSTAHDEPCRVIEVENLWDATVVRVWLPTRDAVVRMPESGLRDLDGQMDSALPELAAHWSMCIATYPFFLDVAANVGRLLGLQGEVAIATLKRRLAERWGDRSLMPQAASKVVRSMTAWGLLRNLKPGLYAGPHRPVSVEPRAGMFLAESLFVGSRQKSLTVQEIERHPALFPFGGIVSLRHLRNSKQFALHRQGVDMELVELASH